MTDTNDKVLNFVEKRKESIEKKRRNFERVLFQNFLGAYTVLDDNGTNYPLQLIDISRDGCLFQVPYDPTRQKHYDIDHELTLRIYFTQSSYIPALVRVKRFQEYIDNDDRLYARYGCEFDKEVGSFEALNSFIEFLYKFAEHSSIDRGDERVFFF